MHLDIKLSSNFTTCRTTTTERKFQKKKDIYVPHLAEAPPTNQLRERKKLHGRGMTICTENAYTSALNDRRERNDESAGLGSTS
jgi:hypothetical protein